MEGAVHGFDVVFLALNVHGGVHPLAVEIEVAGRLPQLGFADVRRVDNLVAARVVFLVPILLDGSADAASHGVPVGQAGPSFLVKAEQVQVTDQPPVISPFHLLQPLEVGLKLLLGGPYGAVDALQHRA